MPSENRTPDGWRQSTLGEIAQLVMGQSPDGSDVNDDGNGTPFLQGNAEFGTRYPTAVFSCTKPGRLSKVGDILISVRAPVGEINVADREYCIGRGLAAIRMPDAERLFGWFLIEASKHRLRRVSQGSTFDAINKDDLAQLPVLLPTESERPRIGATLNAVDDAIERTRDVIDQTRRLKTALLQDLLTTGLPGRHHEFKQVRALGRIPKEWDVVHLGDLGTGDEPVAKTGPFGAQLRGEDFRDDGIPVLNIGNVQPGYLDLSRLDFVGEEAAERLSQYQVLTGDLVFSRSATIGRTTIIPPAADGWLMSYHLIRVRTDATKCEPAFLMNSILYSSALARQIEAVTQGGTRSGVNSQILESLQIPLPKVAEQRATQRAAKVLRAREVEEIDHLRQLGGLKDALSQALLTGSVRARGVR